METKASVKTKCDGCSATLGESYPNKRGSISLNLSDGKDGDGYDKYGRYDFCGESCLCTFLNSRASKNKATASVLQVGGILELDVTQGSGYKKIKV
jgi:hypothetical protein